MTWGFDVFFDLRLKNGWVNNGEAGDLRRNRAHYSVNVMKTAICTCSLLFGETPAICQISFPDTAMGYHLIALQFRPWVYFGWYNENIHFTETILVLCILINIYVCICLQIWNMNMEYRYIARHHDIPFSIIERDCTIDKLRPGQNGSHFADGIFSCIFLNEIAWIRSKSSLKFVPKGQINNISALV